MSSLPRISIVTPTYNQGKYIEQTIQSVLSQNYPNLEFIVIDGGSTDNTLDVINKYGDQITYWISEKDHGQANAINKGLKLCTGEIFNWLNSDDYLEPGALHHIATAFSAGADMVAGVARVFEDGPEEKDAEMVKHSKLSAKGLMYWSQGVQFVQPGVWMRRQLVAECGGIDETFHYSFDWDLYIRYLSRFPHVNYVDKTLIHFRLHAASKTVSLQERFKQEEWKIIRKLSLQNDDIKLQKLAFAKWVEKDWLPFLKESVVARDRSRFSRIKNILAKVSSQNLVLWRATGGAIREIIQGGTA